MEYSKWLQSITDDSQEETARKINVSRRTLQNQLYGNLKPETAIKIAEAYGLNPHLVLHDLEFIQDHWMAELLENRRAQAASLSEEELSEEVLRRMLRGVKTDALTTPVDKHADNIIQINRSSVAPDPEDEEIAEALRRANQRPRAAHPATDVEYTEPEFP